MQRLARALLVLALLVVPVACASGGGGGSSVFRAELGMATEADARSVSDRVFSQFQYTLDRAEDPPSLRLITEWRVRDPFQDERSLGIVEAESRLIVIGRERTISELGSQFAMTLQVENRVRAGTTGEWVDTQNTPQFREYARSIAERLETEFRTIGVRRF